MDEESESPFHHRDHSKKVGKKPEREEEARILAEGATPFHHRDHSKKVGKKPEAHE